MRKLSTPQVAALQFIARYGHAPAYAKSNTLRSIAPLVVSVHPPLMTISPVQLTLGGWSMLDESVQAEVIAAAEEAAHKFNRPSVVWSFTAHTAEELAAEGVTLPESYPAAAPAPEPTGWVSERPAATDAFRTGQTVQTAPHTDSWMRGDRYGKVAKVTATRVTVKLDRSGRTRTFSPADLVPGLNS